MDAKLHKFLEKFQHLKIRLEEIKTATNDFKDNLIGVGGFGNVYKGEVSHSKGRSMVAIKRLDPKSRQGTPEFLKEITMLSEYHDHENLISLLGFCCEGGEMILVYEHASRGSLERYLDSPHLTWSKRLMICLDVAKGLCYLHDPRESHRRLIHCDIKSANILLDDQWNAKVSDFGLSIIASANEEHSIIVTLAAGTRGYCDPEYAMTHTLTKESDVYSFGVVLFEVLCGRLCYSYSNNRIQQTLVDRWVESSKQKQLNDIIFKNPTIQPMDQNALEIFSDIACRCLEESRENRPNMAEVVAELEKALDSQELVECQEYSEWMAQLFYYKEITRTAEPRLKYSSNRELWKLLCEGVFLNGGNTKFEDPKIQLEEITLATNNFNGENYIGGGGFGQVYKGDVSYSKGRSMVAIKRLDPKNGQGIPEFRKEITTLSHYKHENLISLLGYCYQGDEMILAYEFASRGSLDYHLKSPHLTWSQRINICLDAAKGLSYLHDPMETHQRLIHCDVKSANILLDDQWNGKVSDFGLSTMGPANEQQSVIVTYALSTHGYCDPQFAMTHTLTKESDVYTFGVVLLEVLCGRLCCGNNNDHDQQNLVPTWIESYKQNNLNDIIFKHPILQPLDQSALKILSDIAYQCLQRSREERPMMAEVMTKLKTALESQELIESREFSEWKAQVSYYKEITKTAEPPVNCNCTSEVELWKLLSDGVLLNGGKTWFSLNKKGEHCEMISFAECLVSKPSEFDGLSSAYNSRFAVGSYPYTNGSVETRVEHKDEIEKQPVSYSDANWEENLPTDYEDIMKWSTESLQWTTKKEASSILRKGFLINDGIKEPYSILRTRLINYDKTTRIWFFLDKNWKKCHLLSASVGFDWFDWADMISLPESRFGKALQCNFFMLVIHAEIKFHLLSCETTYARYLVYKLPEDLSNFEAPVIVNDMHSNHSWHIYLVSHQTPIIRPNADQNTHNVVNVPKEKGLPQQRNDGWMEVQIGEFQTAATTGEISMSLKLTTCGRMLKGLMIEGVECRPI